MKRTETITVIEDQLEFIFDGQTIEVWNGDESMFGELSTKDIEELVIILSGWRNQILKKDPKCLPLKVDPRAD